MKSSSKVRYRLIALLAFGAIGILYAWTYALPPFSELTDSLILNGATTLSALIAASILTRITFYFHRGEPPRVIWASFAICLWLWTIAEGIWGYTYVIGGEVPVFSLADVLWLAGYIALTVSLAHQFRLVFFDQKYTILWAAFGVWLAVLLIIETILLATHSQTPLEDFFRYFYVFADATVGLSALYLVYAFRGRALAIPWLTISSFVVTDILYIRLTETGAYDWVMSGISIAMLADTLYVVAYLIVAWGVLEQYLLLRFGADQVPA